METQELMGQAQKAMTTYVCRDLDGDDKKAMTHEVQRFFADRVSRLSASEIFDHMATPMKALEWFNTYLCKNVWDNCCSNPLPEYSDARELG